MKASKPAYIGDRKIVGGMHNRPEVKSDGQGNNSVRGLWEQVALSRQLGIRQVGKAADFDSAMRGFESLIPYQ